MKKSQTLMNPAILTAALFMSMASACITSDSPFDSNHCPFSKCYSDNQCSSKICVFTNDSSGFCMLPIWGIILSAIGILLLIVGFICLLCCCCACCCCHASRRRPVRVIEEHHYHGMSRDEDPNAIKISQQVIYPPQ